MPVSFFEVPRPLVFGHRGAAGERPENTIPSFERAIECGCDVLELDVHATRDGTIVVLHDATLDRTTDVSGAVCDQAWDVVREADAGHRFSLDGRTHPFRGRGIRIPRLSEVFERFPEMRFNIEVKQGAPPIAEAVCRLVWDHGCRDRVVLAAEKDDIMLAVRAAAAGRVATSFSAGEVADFIGRVQSGDFGQYDAPGCALQIPVAFGGLELVTPSNLRCAHERGIEIHVWTINDRTEMDRLLDLGVDGIMSDLPAIARGAVAARQGRG